jgi:hypothetical protein
MKSQIKLPYIHLIPPINQKTPPDLFNFQIATYRFPCLPESFTALTEPIRIGRISPISFLISLQQSPKRIIFFFLFRGFFFILQSFLSLSLRVSHCCPRLGPGLFLSLLAWARVRAIWRITFFMDFFPTTHPVWRARWLRLHHIIRLNTEFCCTIGLVGLTSTFGQGQSMMVCVITKTCVCLGKPRRDCNL